MDAANANPPRRFPLSMTPMVGWSLNGRTFERTAVAEDEVVWLNAIEVWEFVNTGGGMGMGPLPHLMHVHKHNLEHEDMGMMRNYQVEAS